MDQQNFEYRDPLLQFETDTENGEQIDETTAATEAEQPKPKRYKKTIDQQIAEAEERLKKLKQKQRAARTHRLCETGGTIEAALGIEFTEKEDRERLQRILTKHRERDDGSTWTWADAIAQAFRDSEAGGDR